MPTTPKKISRSGAKRRSLLKESRSANRAVKVRSEPPTSLLFRKRIGMTRDEFSRMIGVSVRALADAETGKKVVAKFRRPYKEIERLCDALSDVVDSDAIGAWLQSPNEQFGGLKPLEVIERGEMDRIWHMIYILRSGMPG